MISRRRAFSTIALDVDSMFPIGEPKRQAILGSVIAASGMRARISEGTSESLQMISDFRWFSRNPSSAEIPSDRAQDPRHFHQE